ncbi:hypothetical protein B9Z19DRAFT_1070379 [Tuber borchii]|uniref:Uncharacterized protein n=1 Tax=Tuber borchii TaxID=42251 RepID=A0A2T7A9P9_TUBBO|nr:hypothetical protein B9Z19DRAFT_1070379 [Tuber borchii]
MSEWAVWIVCRTGILCARAYVVSDAEIWTRYAFVKFLLVCYPMQLPMTPPFFGLRAGHAWYKYDMAGCETGDCTKAV